MGDDGIKYVAEACKNLKQLKTLGLSNYFYFII